MRTIEYRGRTARLSEPPPAPAPEWWGAAFGRRQRRLRAILVRKLPADGTEVSTTMAAQFACNYERSEVEHALAELCGMGLVLCRPARERAAVNRSEIVNRCYWRL